MATVIPPDESGAPALADDVVQITRGVNLRNHKLLISDIIALTLPIGGGTLTGDLTMTEAKNVVVGTTTGTKIGTAVAQKLGFWNATPVIQQAGATQVALNAYAAGANGLSAGADMAALVNLVIAMRLALVNTGIIKGAA